MSESRAWRALLWSTYVMYLCCTAWLVFAPHATESGWAVEQVTRWLWAHGQPIAKGHVEVALNVVMFVPASLIGMQLWLRSRLWHWALIGVVVSSSIELGQKLVLPDRVADPHDVMANTCGIVIGGVVGLFVRRLLSFPGSRGSASPGRR